MRERKNNRGHSSVLALQRITIVHVLCKLRLKFPSVISPQILTFNVCMLKHARKTFLYRIKQHSLKKIGQVLVLQRSFFVFKILRLTKYEPAEQEILQEEYE